MVKFVLSLFILGTAAQTLASVSSRDFYRQIDAPLASGRLPFNDLYKNRIESHRAWNYLVEAGPIKAWLKEEYLISPGLFTYRTPAVMTAITTEPTTLVIGKVHVPLKEYTSLVLYKISNNEAQVFYGGRIYYAKADHLITAIDMGSSIKAKNGNWYDYDYRKGDVIFTRQGRALNWSQIADFKMASNLAIVKMNLSNPESRDRLFFRQQRVRIKDQKSQHWIISQIREHGQVWWKWQEPTSLAETISTADLQKKELHAIAKSPRNKNLALASSNGIFFTVDGKKWKRLEAFGNENHNLAISSENTLLVGSKYSMDYGKSFHDYISWESVTQRAETILGRPPLYLRLKKISLPRHSHHQINIQVDTGYKNIEFVTSLTRQTPHLIP